MNLLLLILFLSSHLTRCVMLLSHACHDCVANTTVRLGKGRYEGVSEINIVLGG